MAPVSCLLSGGYSPFSSTSPLAIVLRSRPHRRAGGGGGLLAIPVRAAFDRLAPLPAGSPSTASSLQSEHPFHQLDENLAGFEHTGRGVWGGGALLWCLWGGGFQQEGFKPAAIPAERHWHQALHFDSFYFKLSSISLLGKGRREAGEVALVCGESGDAGTVGKPEASWQGCVEFLGIGARKFKVKAREFSGWSGR